MTSTLAAEQLGEHRGRLGDDAEDHPVQVADARRAPAGSPRSASKHQLLVGAS